MNIKVMKEAVNYDEVVSFMYDSSDFITDKIINYYKNYILGYIPKEKYEIKTLDMIVNKYINDSYFNSYIKNNLDDNVDYYYDMDIILSELYEEYLIKENRKYE